MPFCGAISVLCEQHVALTGTFKGKAVEILPNAKTEKVIKFEEDMSSNFTSLSF